MRKNKSLMKRTGFFLSMTLAIIFLFSQITAFAGEAEISVLNPEEEPAVEEIAVDIPAAEPAEEVPADIQAPEPAEEVPADIQAPEPAEEQSAAVSVPQMEATDTVEIPVPTENELPVQDSFVEDAALQVADDPDPLPVPTPPSATLTKVLITANGVELAWNAQEDAALYHIYSKAPTGAWSLLAETAETSYLDQTAYQGSEIWYLVVSCIRDEEGNAVEGPFNEDKIETCIPLPKAALTSVKSGNGGITMSWNAVPGAEGYYLYFWNTNGNVWKKFTSTTALEYTDTNVKQGTRYWYTVAAYNKNGTGEYDYNGLGAIYLPAVSITLIENRNGGVFFQWNAVNGATGYRLYWRYPGDTWHGWADVTGTSYTDSSVASGTTYEYMVVAFTQKGSTKYLGTWNDANKVSIKYLAYPKLKSAAATANGIRITWQAVPGAEYYRIYYWNTDEKQWKRVYTTTDTSTSYEDTVVTSGQHYYYTVRAFSGNTGSGYDDDGIRGMFLTPIKNIYSKVVKNGMTIYWSAVGGAAGYNVYWRKAGGSWSFWKTVTENYVTDTSMDDSVTYEYTAIAVKTVGGTVYQSYWQESYAGKVVHPSEEPAMTRKAQNYSSSTYYLIMINCYTNRMGVYYWSGGKWNLKYYWKCSTGQSESATVKGVFSINGNRGYAFSGSNYTCYYYSSFYGSYLIHSTKFKLGTMEVLDDRLGLDLSGGCVRIAIDNAKWVYYNIPIGTTVVTYAE